MIPDDLDDHATEKLSALAQESCRRTAVFTERLGLSYVVRGGRRLISFSCNDYLSLAHHPDVKAAAVAAIEKYGTSAAASQLVTGRHPLFLELEQELTQYKNTEAACVFGSGYMANVGIIRALMSPNDLIVGDELVHSSIRAGAALSGAAFKTFRHNDPADASRVLSQSRGRYRNALLLTETVFSMDGDLAPIRDLADVCGRYSCWMMTDDAHGIAVLASQAIPHSGQCAANVQLQMGTLSKSLASQGGYVCASRPVIDLLMNRAASFVYSTALPPSAVAAALAAIRFIKANPDYCERPLRNAKRFASKIGLPEAVSPIVPIKVGSAEAALEAASRLEQQGFLVVAIRPPTVPLGSARLRIVFSAAHSDEQIDALAEAVSAVA